MSRRLIVLAALLGLSVGMTSCGKDNEGTPDAEFIPPIDTCNSADAAKSDSSCQAQLGAEVQGYIYPKNDIDYWAVDVPNPPADTKQQILVVSAQYKASYTPVTLSVTVNGPDGKPLGYATAQTEAVPGTMGKAKSVQVAIPFTQGGKYVVMISHDTTGDDPAMDKKSPYYLSVQVTGEPDSKNEPNDTDEKATQIPLSGCVSAVGDNVVEGYLATSGDKDVYKFTVPSTQTQCGGRRAILYMAIKGPASLKALVQLDYVLTAPNGTTIDSGHAVSPTEAQTVASARLAASGTYTLTVKAYQSPSQAKAGEASPADPAFKYGVQLALLTDLDTYETAVGNDKVENANTVDVSSGSASRIGRLAYIGDQDFYKFSNGPYLVHYRLQVTKDDNSARYPVIPGSVQRELTVLSSITNTTTECSDWRQCYSATVSDGYSGWCRDQKLCLWQQRLEGRRYDIHCVPGKNFDPKVNCSQLEQLENFEGEFLVPSGKDMFIRVQYSGGNGADDYQYTLTLTKSAAPDGSDPHTDANPLSVGTSTSFNWGFGAYSDEAPNDQQDLLTRGEQDYDVFDVDYFKAPIANGTRKLNFTWTINSGSGQTTGRSYDVAVNVCRKPTNDDPCPGKIVVSPLNITKDANDQIIYPIKFTPAAAPCVDATYLHEGGIFIQAAAVNRKAYIKNTVDFTLSDEACSSCVNHVCQ